MENSTAPATCNRLFATTGDAVVSLTRVDQQWSINWSLTESKAQCLAIDPHNHDVIYAGSAGQGLFKTNDGGMTWVGCGLPESAVFSVAVSPADGAVYAGCEPSLLFQSNDAGQSWNQLTGLNAIPSAPTWSFPPRPWTSHVRWIATHPTDPLLLLVGIELGGLMKSTDGGQNFADHRPGALRDVHAIAWHPQQPDRAYEAGGEGAAWSLDRGDTWQQLNAGRDRHYVWAVCADPRDPDCWYVSASPGPRNAHSRDNAQAYIYRSQGGGPWQALAGGLPQPLESLPYALCCTGDVLFAGLGDGRIFTSPDRGMHWELLSIDGTPPDRVTALAWSEQS